MKQVLVVVDMQNDFIDAALGSPEAQAIVDKVVNKIATWPGDIVATFDTHGKDYMNTREGTHLPVPHCIKGTDGHKLNPKVRKAFSETHKLIKCFEKPTFGSEDLIRYLVESGYTDIEFVGLCTDICVVSNVMLAKAALPEAEITVDAECCAGVTPESHLHALHTMNACQVNIINFHQ